ncbi:MAG: thylakoid membrane photosystem I accumulation factor [Pseudanabaenaceae cyanobacterium]
MSAKKIGYWLAVICLLLYCWFSPHWAWAGIEDDYYEGNIFVLYAGNGSLVPPKLNLKQSLQLGKPAVLVFYVDDSRDCKKFAINLNRWQARYTPQLSIIPINADSLSPEVEEAQYFKGLVPQTVVVDRQGQVRLNVVGANKGAQVEEALQSLLAVSNQ